MLIGLSASVAWSGAGRIAGVSGILGGFLRAPTERGFRPGFLLGLLLTSLVIGALALPRLPGSNGEARSLVALVVAGLLVGFGTQLGGGCTSGHGVCGISRLSPRSLAATATFMLCAALVVFVTRHVWAGAAP
jgi:uncharacterized membrane protein YedE/YeeE